MTLRFARLSEQARPPAHAHEGDAGYDLFAAESARLEPGERASVGTGIAVAIPDGCAGLVRASQPSCPWRPSPPSPSGP